MDFKYYELTERQRLILLKIWELADKNLKGVVDFDLLVKETGEPKGNLMATLNVLKRQYRAIGMQSHKEKIFYKEPDGLGLPYYWSTTLYVWPSASRAEVIQQINGLVHQIRKTYAGKETA